MLGHDIDADGKESDGECHKPAGSGVQVADMGTRNESATAHRPASDRSVPDAWFTEIYPQLHRIACIAAPADVDPDDLVQDALVRYLQQIDSVLIHSPKSYLSATIVNLASNERRTWTRRTVAYRRIGTAGPTEDAYPSDLDDLEHVTPQERVVLYLHHVDGLPFTDIAATVGSTPDAVRQAASRARRHLSRTLKEGNQ